MADVLAMDRDVIFFLAGRLPPDVKAWVQRYPEATSMLVRAELRK